MSEYIIFSIAVILCLFIGFYFGKQLSKSTHSSATSALEERNRQLQAQLLAQEERTEKLQKEIEERRSEKERVQNELTRRETEFDNLRQKNEEQKAEVEKLQEKFQKEFENLANKIFDQKSEKFTNVNKENIKNILDPLQEKIKNFEKKVDDSREASVHRHAKLGKYLEQLQEQNVKISEEATNLTKALKADTKMQGGWGELILRRVLEKSGLQKDSEYFEQQSFTTEEGKRVMPDFIIHLPGNKKMIIDSKVSLAAYERYVNETEETEKQKHLKNHLLSIQNHVRGLGQKEYQKIYQMDSPDFVLLFIPNESAFAVASNQHPKLYSEAFDRNIIIVTPTTLLAVLKTIDSMWQNEKQKQNAVDIAKQAGALYDSFVNLIGEMDNIGRQIGTLQNTYERAEKKLKGKGNMITRVENLKKLGAKASKQIDPKLLARSENDNELEQS